YLFFLQAEDGLRDFQVTGVQTCALPISRPPSAAPARRRIAARAIAAPACARASRGAPIERNAPARASPAAPAARAEAPGLSSSRSEERRGGKERRSRETACRNKMKRRRK